MLVTPQSNSIAKIKVVGLGGAGGNAVNTMISDFNIEGVDFMAFNTDQQALKNTLAPVSLQLGDELTRGLGVGGDHMLGAQAAEESIDAVHEHLAGADMVFLTAGMGGGTGTGSIPVVAGIAKNMGALTVAVVTKPFAFEGKKRAEVAEEGIAALRDKVDTLIVVPNQRLLDIIDEDISFFEAMKKVDNVLAEGVKSITSLVTQTGYINVDFADVKAVMQDAGTAIMGIGKAKGENRAEDAARMATTSPLLDMSIEGAKGILFNVIGGLNMTMKEIDYAAQMIEEAVDPSANIIFGASIDESLADEMIITVVATGFDGDRSAGEGLVSKRSDTVIRNVSDTPKKPSTESSIGGLSINDFELDEEEDKDEKKSDDSVKSGKDTDGDLEVPAFLRRK